MKALLVAQVVARSQVTPSGVMECAAVLDAALTAFGLSAAASTLDLSAAAASAAHKRGLAGDASGVYM